MNTGWTGGRYGVGKRISISDTKEIINAIHDGRINEGEFETLPVFNLKYPKSIKGVNSAILNPESTWANKDEYKVTLRRVAEMFNENFHRYDHLASDAVKSGAPKL